MNEVVTALAGLVMSAPALMNLGSKIAGWTGKKINNQALQNASVWLSNKGNKVHHAYETAIQAMLKKMFPKADQQKLEKASKIVFLTIIGSLATVSGSGALHAVGHGNHALASIEGILASVKTGEIAKAVIDTLPKTLSVLGLFK